MTKANVYLPGCVHLPGMCYLSITNNSSTEQELAIPSGSPLRFYFEDLAFSSTSTCHRRNRAFLDKLGKPTGCTDFYLPERLAKNQEFRISYILKTPKPSLTHAPISKRTWFWLLKQSVFTSVFFEEDWFDITLSKQTNKMQKVGLFYSSYPQGTDNTLARPMPFLIQGKDERWMKRRFALK